MLIRNIFVLFLWTCIHAVSARKQAERVLLSNVKTLTVRKDVKTTANRVSAIPQLKCIGGTAKDLYDVDVLRCKNAGSSYGDADVEWTCTASLPAEFKLGSTDVICEGFASPDDPYILKGSCGVEYRLMLTELGREKYGKGQESYWPISGEGNKAGTIASNIFWIMFIAVAIWIAYSAYIQYQGGRRPGWRPGPGTGNGDGGGNDDPPPPYDQRPGYSMPRNYGKASSLPGQQTGWRPGFWTGALGGAAAGLLAGNRGGRTQTTGWGNGEGSSNWGSPAMQPRRSPGSSSSYGSSRHESSGFGGTTRR